MKTLEITDMDDFTPIHLVADLATLVGTYQQGFAVTPLPPPPLFCQSLRAARLCLQGDERSSLDDLRGTAVPCGV